MVTDNQKITIPPSPGWKPDFTKASPFEGITPEYIEREAATFKPTEAFPLPLSQRTAEGRAAREAAGVPSPPPIVEPEPPPPEPEIIELEPEPVVTPTIITGIVDESLLRVGPSAGKETAKKVHPEFVALVESGASILEIWEAAQGVSGSYAFGIRELIASQFRAASELEGEARVEANRALGFLPEGFDDFPQELKDAYGVSDKAFNTAVEAYNRDIVERQAEVQTALDKLAPFMDAQGNYNLQAAFDAGKGADVSAAGTLGIFTPEQILEAQFGAIEVRAVARVVEEERADFEVALEESDPNLYAIYQARGAEGYNTYIEDNYTKLPDDQYIDNTQLAEIRDTAPNIYEALMTGGIVAADKIVQEQQEALTNLRGYEIYPYSEALMYEMVKSGEYTVAEIVAKRQKEVTGYNVAQYLRTNPGDTQTLITAGFDAQVIMPLNAALIATKGHWVDNNLDVYTAMLSGVGTKHLETLTGKTEEEIKGLRPPMQQFYQSYFQSNPPDMKDPKLVLLSVAEYNMLPGNVKETGKRDKWYSEADRKYRELYGVMATTKAVMVDLPSIIFPPARVLEPTVEMGDIQWWEWVLGGVNIAAIAVPLWIPPVVRGVKWVFPKLKIGTYPFSEPAISKIQLQRTRLLGTKTITAGEVGMSDAQFTRFIKFRVIHRGTTPFDFKAMEAFNTESLVAEALRLVKAGQKIPTRVSGLTPAQLAAQAKILTQATEAARQLIRVGKWLASERLYWVKQIGAERVLAIEKAYATAVASRVAQLAEVTAQQSLTSSQIVAQAAKNEAMWRAMAEASIARVQPTGFYIPDFPFVIPLAISNLRINMQQLAGIQPLTTFQINAIAKATGLTRSEVRSGAKVGNLAEILAKPTTVVKIIATTQGLTTTQIKELTEALTKLQGLTQAGVASLTEAQTKVLAEALTKAMTSEALAIEVATAVAELTKVLPATETKAVTEAAVEAMTKAIAEGKTKAEAQIATQVAIQTTLQTITPITPVTPVTPITPVIPITPPITPPPILGLPRMITVSPIAQPIPEGSYAWRQGMYWKYIPPPYDQSKPITLKRGVAPMGATKLDGRTPAQTIQIIGRSRKYRIPDRVDVDMGVVDIFITPEAGGTIVFAGKGLETNVGSRIDSPTKGMDLGEGDGIDRQLFGDETFPGSPISGKGISRPLFSKKKPPRKKRKKGNDFSDILEIRGEI